MLRVRALLPFLFAAVLGCDGTANLTGPGGSGDFPEFDGAQLIVTSPEAAAIYLREDPVPFEAQVVGADGSVLDFDEIVWTTDQEEGEVFVGRSGAEFLPWGIHALTATAELPNGDRLVYVAGGVRVQGEHSGIYAGNLNITLDAEFQGTPVSGSCNGGLDFIVDMSGTLMDGGGGCTVDLLILGQFDVSYALDASIFDDDAEGSIGVDVGFFELPVDWEGEFDSNDEFEADFAGGALLFDLTGEIAATRVSPYVDP